jgi:mycothiol synthase
VPAFGVERVTGDAAPIAAALDSEVAHATGHPALGAAVWRDLERPRPSTADLVARVDGRVVAFVHVGPSDTATPGEWLAGAAVEPVADAGAVLPPLLDAAAEHVAAHGGGRILLWLLGATTADGDAAAAASFTPAGGVCEMRVALPIAVPVAWPPGIECRPFEPGRDEAAWIAANNRAFGDHPDQGHWTEATLARRMAETWFDPSLFLLAFDDVGLAGFNWLKVHPPSGHDPEIGEIYAIGVDPRAQGTGLGRALAVAGLDVVTRRGITVGMLYTALDNDAALVLYRSLGFETRRVDRSYERVVEGVEGGRP